jgi:hypothetical protein
MKLVHIVNKLKMNLDKRGLVEVRNTNLAKRLLTYLECAGISFEELGNFLVVDLSKHSIQTIKSYAQFLKYDNKELKKLVFSSISKNSGQFIFTTSVAPFVESHEVLMNERRGGNLICYLRLDK